VATIQQSAQMARDRGFGASEHGKKMRAIEIFDISDPTELVQ
jgi:hypothetical protein